MQAPSMKALIISVSLHQPSRIKQASHSPGRALAPGPDTLAMSIHIHNSHNHQVTLGCQPNQIDHLYQRSCSMLGKYQCATVTLHGCD